MINNKNPKLKLEYYRTLKGISQTKLAAKLQTSQGYISEIEKNLKSPTLRFLYQISDALEICPCLLLPCIIEYRNQCLDECEMNIHENSDI